MDLSTSVPADVGAPFADIIASDRAYFRLGARFETVPGAEVCVIPALAHNPAASVVQCVDAGQVAGGGAGWIAGIEDRLEAAGVRIARLYLDQPGTVADTVLRAAGYEPREEIAFAGTVTGSGDAEDAGLSYTTITDEAGWARKLAFHEGSADRPDGHASPAAEWVAIERVRCSGGQAATGAMQALLCERGGSPVGAFGLIDAGRYLRVKNLVVHPGERRGGVGIAMLRKASQLAAARGHAGLCLFGVAGHAGEALYRAAGLREHGRQVEWSRSLGAAHR